MDTLPRCTQCASEYTYQSGLMLACPDCGHEWNPQDNTADTNTADTNTADTNTADAPLGVKDAYGNILQDGDSVTVIKDLKVRGSTTVVKQGTKVKNIRLGGGDHDIDCKVDGIGAMKLKSEFVKKS